MSEDLCDLLCLDLPRAEALRRSRLDVDLAAPVAERLRALSDPTRLTLLASLRDADELCVCDLAWIVERAHNLVSHHLRLLRAAGLVRSRRHGKMVMYALTVDGRTQVAAVLAPLAEETMA